MKRTIGFIGYSVAAAIAVATLTLAGYTKAALGLLILLAVAGSLQYYRSGALPAQSGKSREGRLYSWLGLILVFAIQLKLLVKCIAIHRQHAKVSVGIPVEFGLMFLFVCFLMAPISRERASEAPHGPL